MIENALKAKYNSGAVTLGYRIDENKDCQFDPIAAPAQPFVESGILPFQPIVACKIRCNLV